MLPSDVRRSSPKAPTAAAGVAGAARAVGWGRRLALGLVALPFMAAPGLGAPPPVACGATELLSLAAPLADEDLAELRGGFSVGGFDLSVGIVARSVLGQGDGVGERLEVVSRFSVPGVGRIAHDGTSVQTLPALGGGDDPLAGVLPGSAVVISSLGTGAMIDVNGTTRLTHRLLDAFVENSDVNRAITRQLDINLEVGGLARRLGAARAAQVLRPAVEAQILYGRR